MRTAAQIENGVVVNIIVIEDGDLGDETLNAIPGLVEVTNKDVRITDEFRDGKFVRVYSQIELDNMAAQAEWKNRRDQVLAKLGLTENEARDLLGL